MFLTQNMLKTTVMTTLVLVVND